jgi:sulfur carrier protein|uniref:sulfur carrier protein ThiS n=1 Tax=Candidatus Pelagibacter sp. TaxID=2024849 RepID=UPI00404A03A7
MMKKIKKIKIKINGKIILVNDNSNLQELVNKLKIPVKKVAIELNQEIIDKSKLKKYILKKKDKIEIVHFIGGG